MAVGEGMSEWQCYHLDDTLTAIVVSDGHRFLVRMREPAGENRQPIEFFRWTLKDARKAADRLVQAYYPHECDKSCCGLWREHP